MHGGQRRNDLGCDQYGNDARRAHRVAVPRVFQLGLLLPGGQHVGADLLLARALLRPHGLDCRVGRVHRGHICHCRAECMHECVYELLRTIVFAVCANVLRCRIILQHHGHVVADSVSARHFFYLLRVSVSRLFARTLLPVVLTHRFHRVPYQELLPNFGHGDASLVSERHVLREHCNVCRHAVHAGIILRFARTVGADRTVHGRFFLYCRIIDRDAESVPEHDVLPDGLVANDRVPPRRILPFERHGH